MDAASSARLQGTTEYTASLIQQKIGGDLYLIQTAEPYPADYDAVVEQNHQEQEDGTIPELSSVIEDMEQYDTVFIGYPIWATSLPQPVVSFLHQYDLSGKTIIPFCPHAGYGCGNSYMKIREICPDAQVLEGLTIEAEEIGPAETEISRWLEMLQSGSDEMQGTVSSSEIRITIGDAKLSARLNNSVAAREFKEMLPVTLSMTRMGEHEYYGSLEQNLTHTRDLQIGYTVGDLAFWTPGDLFAIYFDEPEEAPEGLMILGSITSELSIFKKLGNPEEVRIECIQEQP